MGLAEVLARRDEQVHVVGIAGTEGAGMLRLLHGMGFANLVAHDIHEERDFRPAFSAAHAGLDKVRRRELLREVACIPKKWCRGELYLQGIEDASLVVVPQSWRLYPENEPLIRMHEQGVDFLTLTQAFFWLFEGTIVAVTGTKGKSTTASMIDRILSLSPVKHAYSGNDRRSEQAIDALLDPDRAEVLLLEVSNRQLADAHIHPDIAVLTNVLEDHIEEHGGFEGYMGVKASVFGEQDSSDVAIVNYDNEWSRSIAEGVAARVRWFGTEATFSDGAFLRDDTVVVGGPEGTADVCTREDIQVSGSHNIHNAMAAALVCDTLGIDFQTIREGLRDFQGLPGRMQLVGERQGIRFYNDINSTIPAATIAGLDSIEGKVTLIVGGQSKGMDYSQLAARVQERVDTVVLLPGTGSDALAQLLGDASSTLLLHCDTLPEAVDCALRSSAPNSAILLSPASASFYGSYVRPLNRTVSKIVREALE